MSESFRVTGTISEVETGRPLAGLIVRAFDEDLVFDDKLGFATTDADGNFEIRFRTEDFRDVRESRPDLYLKVYDPSGARLLHETTHAVRKEAGTLERYRIKLPASALAGPRGA